MIEDMKCSQRCVFELKSIKTLFLAVPIISGAFTDEFVRGNNNSQVTIKH